MNDLWPYPLEAAGVLPGGVLDGFSQSLSTGGGMGVDTVVVETSPMIWRASLVAWYMRRSSSRLWASSADSSIMDCYGGQNVWHLITSLPNHLSTIISATHIAKINSIFFNSFCMFCLARSWWEIYSYQDIKRVIISLIYIFTWSRPPAVTRWQDVTYLVSTGVQLGEQLWANELLQLVT